LNTEDDESEDETYKPPKAHRALSEESIEGYTIAEDGLEAILDGGGKRKRKQIVTSLNEESGGSKKVCHDFLFLFVRILTSAPPVDQEEKNK